MSPNKQPNKNSHIYLAFLLFNLLAMQTFPGFTQVHCVILQVDKGEVTYTNHGKKVIVKTTLVIDDTCWVDSRKGGAVYRLVKGKTCSVVAEKCLRQVRSNFFDKCDAVDGSVVKTLQAMYFYLHLDEPRKVKGKPVAIANPVRYSPLFPVTGEHEESRSSIEGKCLVAGNDGQQTDSWQDLAYIFIHSGPDHQAGQVLHSKTFWLSADSADSAPKLITANWGDIRQVKLQKGESDTNFVQLVFYLNNRTDVNRMIRIAGAGELDSLNTRLRRLAEIRPLLSDEHYQLGKAQIYNDFCMYSKAEQVYLDALADHPTSAELKESWKGFLSDCLDKNKIRATIMAKK
jgi:hypothetical protein